jgi:hypothetical protein
MRFEGRLSRKEALVGVIWASQYGQKPTPSDGAIIYDQVKNHILSLSDIDETKMKTTAERMAAPQDSKKQIR